MRRRRRLNEKPPKGGFVIQTLDSGFRRNDNDVAGAGATRN